MSKSCFPVQNMGENSHPCKNLKFKNYFFKKKILTRGETGENYVFPPLDQ